MLSETQINVSRNKLNYAPKQSQKLLHILNLHFSHYNWSKLQVNWRHFQWNFPPIQNWPHWSFCFLLLYTFDEIFVLQTFSSFCDNMRDISSRMCSPGNFWKYALWTQKVNVHKIACIVQFPRLISEHVGPRICVGKLAKVLKFFSFLRPCFHFPGLVWEICEGWIGGPASGRSNFNTIFWKMKLFDGFLFKLGLVFVFHTNLKLQRSI